MQRALKDLQGGSVVNIAVARDLKDRISAQKASVASATEAFAALGGSFKPVAKGAAEAGEGSKQLSAALGSAQGPLGGVLGRLSGIARMLVSGGIVAGLVAMAAAVVALDAALIAGVAALARYGLAQADARRSELLHLEGLTKLRMGWMALAVGMQLPADKASFLQSTIDSVSGSVAISREQVAGYAEELYRTGLRSGNLQAALQGMATVSATQGEAAAQQFKGMAMGAALAGTSVKALAGDVKARLGGIAAAQMLSLSVQSAKLHESFAMLFSGLNLDKLLKGVSLVTDLFKQSSVSGRALKFLIETLFQPMADFAGGTGGLLIKRFFQGLVIGALILSLTILKVRNALKHAFGDSDILSSITAQRAAVMLGVVAISLLVGSLFAVVVAGVLVVGAFAAITAAIFAIPAAIIALGGWFADLGAKAEKWGADIVRGIVSGITSATPYAIKAIKGLGTSIEKAFTGHLEIHSPSKLFRRETRVGIGGGIAGGLDDSHPIVRQAMIRLAPEPESRGASPARVQSQSAQGGSSRSGGPLVHIEHMTLSGSNAVEQARDFVSQLQLALAGAAIQLGASTS